MIKVTSKGTLSLNLPVTIGYMCCCHLRQRHAYRVPGGFCLQEWERIRLWVRELKTWLQWQTCRCRRSPLTAVELAWFWVCRLGFVNGERSGVTAGGHHIRYCWGAGIGGFGHCCHHNESSSCLSKFASLPCHWLSATEGTLCGGCHVGNGLVTEDPPSVLCDRIPCFALRRNLG